MIGDPDPPPVHCGQDAPSRDDGVVHGGCADVRDSSVRVATVWMERPTWA